MRACCLSIILVAITLGAADIASEADTAQIKSAIAALGSNDFMVRDAANTELQKLGALAHPELLRIKSPDAEVTKSVKALLGLLPPEREGLAENWRQIDPQILALKLYEEWESEHKRLAAADLSVARFVGSRRSNIAAIKRDFARVFRRSSEPVLTAIENLRKTHPEQKIVYKNGYDERISPAIFLSSLGEQTDSFTSDATYSSSQRLIAAAQREVVPNAEEWKQLREDMDIGASGPKIGMVFNDATLMDVLFTIVTQSGTLRIFPEPKKLADEWYDKKVSIRLDCGSPEKAIALAFAALPEYEYTFAGRGENRYIVIRKKAAK